MKNHILNEEEKDKDSDSVKIYLKNLAEPLSITVGDPASFAKFINKLDNYKVLDKFFNFKDTDEEDISINLAHLQLVETNQPFLDKCQEILLNETIESLDMKIATKKKH
jgi:hypothetical protein